MLSREAFTERVLSQLLQSHPGVEIANRLPDGATIVFPGGHKAGLFTDRAYSFYVAHPEKREHLIAELIATIKNPDESTAPADRFDDLAPYLLPRLKPREYEDVSTRQLGTIGTTEKAGLVFGRVGGSVSIVYGIDKPNEPERVLVTHADALRWNIGGADLHQRAVANLSRRAPVRISLTSTAVSGPLVVVEPIDAYGATRLLIAEVLTAAASALKAAEITLAIPAADALVAMSPENEKGIAWLRNDFVPRKVEGSAEPITDRLFCYDASSGSLSEI